MARDHVFTLYQVRPQKSWFLSVLVIDNLMIKWKTLFPKLSGIAQHFLSQQDQRKHGLQLFCCDIITTNSSPDISNISVSYIILVKTIHVLLFSLEIIQFR